MKKIFSNSGICRVPTAPAVQHPTAPAVQLLIALAVLALCATSCNVTRRITTESSYLQRGDTAVVITTKTIETYDARKNLGY